MKCLKLVVPLAGLLIGCAQAPSASTSIGAAPMVGKQASAVAPRQQAAIGSTTAPTSDRQSVPLPGEFSGGPEERLRQNQVEVDNRIGDSAFRADQAKAASGDADAALRVADIYRRGSSGVSPDERRMVQWLLHASALNNAAASYQLYQYYLQLRLDREAVFFENRAISQGYTLPPRLDPRRS